MSRDYPYYFNEESASTASFWTSSGGLDVPSSPLWESGSGYVLDSNGYAVTPSPLWGVAPEYVLDPSNGVALWDTLPDALVDPVFQYISDLMDEEMEEHGSVDTSGEKWLNDVLDAVDKTPPASSSLEQVDKERVEVRSPSSHPNSSSNLSSNSNPSSGSGLSSVENRDNVSESAVFSDEARSSSVAADELMQADSNNVDSGPILSSGVDLANRVMSFEETVRILLENGSGGAELRRMVYDEYRKDDRVEKSSPSSSVDSSVSFVKNETLKAEMVAEGLYADRPPPPTHTKTRKQRSAAKKEEKSSVTATAKLLDSTIDLRTLLLTSAKAAGTGDSRKAYLALEEVRRHASPQGNAMQRVVHYFAEALNARLSGTGSSLYKTMLSNRPSVARILKAYHILFQVCPFMKLSHYFANQNILKAVEGALRVHIVDYGILFGFQWPYLISCLAARLGGPPHLRITGIDSAQSRKRIEETGKHLAEYARTYGVPFEYHIIAEKWESIQVADLRLRSDEVLVANCMLRLRHLMDESAMEVNPRKLFPSRVHSMTPKIFTVGVASASFNAPFFESRFREALYYYSSTLDMFETVISGGDEATRWMLETEVTGREILNVVACEGMERVERPETYRQWHARLQSAGFEPVPMDRKILTRAQVECQSFYHKEFVVEEDKNWMILGWKGRIMRGFSAWRP